MASLMQLLGLLILVPGVSAWTTYYDFFGGSVTYTPKGQNSNGTYLVELRNKQTNYHCTQNFFSCARGNCGTDVQSNITTVSLSPYGYPWCHQELVINLKVDENLPFELKYPVTHDRYTGQGYWITNTKSLRALWNMVVLVDLGTRSDTGEANRPPTITSFPPLRITQNCPRTYNLLMFDHEGDQVRCRFATFEASECSLGYVPEGFSLDQRSCTLTYSYTRALGKSAFELMVEDFPTKPITVRYSDGSYTVKRPPVGGRRRRVVEVEATSRFPLETIANAIPGNMTEALAANATTNPVTTYDGPTDHTTGPFTTIPPTTTAPSSTGAPLRPTTAALSKLPLQFIVHVDSHHADSCLEGDYFPIFVPPSPRNGENLPAFVNQTFEITVKATAKHTSIVDLIVSGPAGTTKHKISSDEYAINWTPSENEVDDHFPFCFYFEAEDDHSRIYQSNLRCVVADVAQNETIVHCNETTMMVVLRKSYLIRRMESNLHLMKSNSDACSLTKHSNSTHLVAAMKLNDCGTTLEEDDNNIIFKNKITSGDTSVVVSRQNDVEIAFSCVYPKRTNLTLGFRHKNPYAFSEKGFGAFTFQFEFFESQRFRKQIDSSTYPVEVNLKQMMFMQIEASTSIPNTELFVESCRATPYDNPNSRIGYSIIEHGCVKDSTVQIYPGSSAQFRFGMEAFEFIGAYTEVYITCSVILCDTTVPDTRCAQGCVRSSSGNHRNKREAADQTSRHYLSQGPLHLVQTPDSEASGSSLNLCLNLLLVASCLLACGVMVHHVKVSKAKYTLLSSVEAG